MVERSERKWLWGFALLVIALTALPYLLGYFTQGAGWRYTGLLMGIEDGNSYIAKMLRGANGDWLFITPYTAYPQRGALMQTAFFVLGKLAAPPGQHEQLVAIFHLFRAAGIILYVFAAYDFIALFVHERRWRRLATALVALGEGLGWLSLVGLGGLWGKELPLDYYSPETFGFLFLLALPHLACARAFLLWGLREYLQPSGAGRRNLLRVGLLWLGVWIMQPLTVLVGWAVIGTHLAVTAAWQFWQRRVSRPADWATWKWYLRRALRIGILSAPLVIYTYVSFKVDPYLSGWETQNRILSPSFTHYLLAYGLILPFAILGIRPLLREMSWFGWLVVGWLAIFPLLAYAPYNLQRRLPEGVWAAMVILFVQWIECGRPVVRRWGPRWAGLSFLTTIALLAGGILSTASPRAPLFLPTGEVQAFDYLAGKASPQDVVLASYATANPLPAWAGVHVIVGHGPESIRKPELLKRVSCFYNDCADVDRVNLLLEFGVRYVFWGPEERKLGDWDPRSAAYLKPVYQEGDYLVLEYRGGS